MIIKELQNIYKICHKTICSKDKLITNNCSFSIVRRSKIANMRIPTTIRFLIIWTTLSFWRMIMWTIWLLIYSSTKTWKSTFITIIAITCYYFFSVRKITIITSTGLWKTMKTYPTLQFSHLLDGINVADVSKS